MDLNEILNKHSGSSKRPGSYISLTSGNSPAVSSLFEKLSIRDLYLIRSLHLELTLSPATPDSIEQFLLDHVDHNISQLLDTSFTALKYDRNTELGFESRKKMKSLLE